MVKYWRTGKVHNGSYFFRPLWGSYDVWRIRQRHLSRTYSDFIHIISLHFLLFVRQCEDFDASQLWKSASRDSRIFMQSKKIHLSSYGGPCYSESSRINLLFDNQWRTNKLPVI